MKNVTVLDSLVDCFRRHSPEAGHDFWTWIGLFLLSLYSNSHRNAAPKPRILSESCFVTDFCFCFLIVLSLSSLATIRPSMIVSFYHRRLHPSSDQPSFCSCLSVSRLWPSPLSGSLVTLLSCRTDLNHTLSSVLLPSFFVAWQGRCTKGRKCRESWGINDTQGFQWFCIKTKWIDLIERKVGPIPWRGRRKKSKRSTFVLLR